MEKTNKIFLWLLLLSIMVVIGSTGNKFLIQKDYKFIVEAPCDPKTEGCLSRDCSSEECPPNELENYQQFQISARDFSKCSDNSCVTQCKYGIIKCEKVE